MHDSTHQEGRELITVEHFINLSAELNYHLSAAQPNPEALLALILGPSRVPNPEPLKIAMEAIKLGYGESRRKLGPQAVLHPLRTASVISRTMPEPTMLDLLGGLLHDRGEDLTDEAIPKKNLARFYEVLGDLKKDIGSEHEWYLGERIELYTREPGMGYFEYLLRLLDRSRQMPDLLHVKLADRLDNTLDNHVGRPGVLRYNFYRSVFDLLFVPVYKGVKIRQYHFLPSPDEGALLLMQLFKNAVFLSLIRSEHLANLDVATERLFDALAIASIREVQWIALELFANYSEEHGLARLREMVLDTMIYSYSGGAVEVHASERTHGLDGLFLDNYAIADAMERKNRMRELFRDREYLIRALITFIATFASFLNDPEFSIEGIDREGIQAVEPGRWRTRNSGNGKGA